MTADQPPGTPGVQPSGEPADGVTVLEITPELMAAILGETADDVPCADAPENPPPQEAGGGP
jgi:hypothetical protein